MSMSMSLYIQESDADLDDLSGVDDRIEGSSYDKLTNQPIDKPESTTPAANEAKIASI
jgi:hypothetical protein